MQSNLSASNPYSPNAFPAGTGPPTDGANVTTSLGTLGPDTTNSLLQISASTGLAITGITGPTGTTVLTYNPTTGVVSYNTVCLLYTSPSPRDGLLSRMPSSA